jgi:hypothetical protein
MTLKALSGTFGRGQASHGQGQGHEGQGQGDYNFGAGYPDAAYSIMGMNSDLSIRGHMPSSSSFDPRTNPS